YREYLRKAVRADWRIDAPVPTCRDAGEGEAGIDWADRRARGNNSGPGPRRCEWEDQVRRSGELGSISGEAVRGPGNRSMDCAVCSDAGVGRAQRLSVERSGIDACAGVAELARSGEACRALASMAGVRGDVFVEDGSEAGGRVGTEVGVGRESG